MNHHDIDFYRSRLPVNKSLLDDELEVQSQYQEQISQRVTQANTQMLQAKNRLDRVTGLAMQGIKADKTSDTVAANLVKSDPQHIEAWGQYQAARAQHEDWVGLYAAWQGRGYSIKDLVSLYGAQYFAINYAGSTPSRPRSVPTPSPQPQVKETSHPTPPRRRINQ